MNKMYYFIKCPVTGNNWILSDEDNVIKGNNQIRVEVGLDPVPGGGSYSDKDGLFWRDPKLGDDGPFEY